MTKQVFFISDLHLPLATSGIDGPRGVEDKLLDWLDYIQPEAEALFLLGDIFDFWFEYKHLVPKGAFRFQAKLWAFFKANIPVYFFLGNHDGWAIDYLTQECGVQIFRKPASITIADKRFLVGHGDTFGANIGYTLLRKLYDSSWLQACVRTLPPDWFYAMVNRYLITKRYFLNKKYNNCSFYQEKDRIFRHCKDVIEPFNHHEFYIFGHTHCPYIKTISDSSSYCNIGDWVWHYTYASFDGATFSLRTF